MARVALVASSHDRESRIGEPVLEALRMRDIEARLVDWADPSTRWSSFDAVVIGSTDYESGQQDTFVKWTQSLRKVLNPAEALTWNQDKQYVLDLAKAGIVSVPTSIALIDQPCELPDDGDFVVKPTTYRGASHIARFDGTSEEHRGLARRRIQQWWEKGVPVVVQPYQLGVEVYGETSLIYFRGRYSHAIRKSAMLDRVNVNAPIPPAREERIAARTPLSAEYAVADEVCALLPEVMGESVESLIYARIDLVPGPSGLPIVLGVDLASPMSFLHKDPYASTRFGGAVAEYLQEAETVSRVPVPRESSESDAKVGV